MGTKVSNLCIKVPRERAEVLRRALQKMELLDHSRSIVQSKNDEKVLIPITHEPSAEEMQALTQLSPIELLHSDLPSPRVRPKDLISALDGTLPPHLLALLPRSFDIVGDIAVIEDLAPELIPHAETLGKAIMLVHPRVKTVLLKSGKVDGEFRIPRFALLAGEENYETIHTEYGVKLKVNLSKAYFSPRLATEHHRVASQVRDGEVVVDMFAGVGPFSILIANRTSAKVFSVDINPDAIALLRVSINLNRLRGEIIPLCGDVRSFVPQLRGVADRVIMNLPASSLDYLDVAATLLKRDGGIVHLYLFAKEDPLQNAREILAAKLDNLVRSYEVRNARIVKPVAPREWQVALDIFMVP